MSVPKSASKGGEGKLSISSHSHSSVASAKRSGGNFTASTKKRECICGRPECTGITNAFYILDDPRGGFTSLPKWTKGKDNERNQLRGAYLRHIFQDQKPGNSPNSADIKVDYFFSVLETSGSGEGEESEGATTREQDDTDEDRENADIDKDPKGNAGSRNEKQSNKQYIANHHFHPQIVRNSTTTVQVPQKTTTVAGRIPVKIKNGATKPRFKTSMPMYITESDLLELGIQPHEEDAVIDDSGFPLGYFFVVPNYTLKQAQHDLSISAKARRIINDRIEAKQKHQRPHESLGGEISSNDISELSSSLASHHAKFVAASLEQNQRNRQQQQERALPSLSDANINKVGISKVSSLATKDEENKHPNYDNTKKDEKKKKDRKIGNHANTFANANQNKRETGDNDDGSNSSPSFEMMMNESKNALLLISEDGEEQTAMTSFLSNPFTAAAAAPITVSTRSRRNADLEEAKSQLLSSSSSKTNKPMNDMEEEQEDWFSEEFMKKASQSESSPETFLDNKDIEAGNNTKATTTTDTAHVASSNTAVELKEELDKAEYWFSSPLFKPKSIKNKITNNEVSESVGNVHIEGDVGKISDNLAVDSSFDSVFEKVWSEKISLSTNSNEKEEDIVPAVRQKDNDKKGESISVQDDDGDWFSPAAFEANFNVTTTNSTNSEETKLDETKTLPKDKTCQARNIEFDSEIQDQERKIVSVDTASLVLPSKLLKNETTSTASPSKASNQNQTNVAQMVSKKEEQEEKKQRHHHQQPQQHRQQQQESTKAPKAQIQGGSVAALASNFDSKSVTAPSQKEVNDKDPSKDNDREQGSVVSLASNLNSKPATRVMAKKEGNLIKDDALVQGGSVAALANSFDSKLSKDEGERPGDKVFPKHDATPNSKPATTATPKSEEESSKADAVFQGGSVAALANSFDSKLSKDEGERPGDKVFPKYDATPNSKPATTVTVKKEEESSKADAVVEGGSVAALANSFDSKLSKDEVERPGDKVLPKHDSWIKSKPVTLVTVNREEDLIKDDAVVEGGSVAALANSFDSKLSKNEKERSGVAKVSPERSVAALANNFDSKLTIETEKGNDSPNGTPRENKSAGRIRVDSDRFHGGSEEECSSLKELSTVNLDIDDDHDGDVKDTKTVTSLTKLYMKNFESPTRAFSSSTNISRAGTPISSPQRQIVDDQNGLLTNKGSNTTTGGSPFKTKASAFMPFQQVPSKYATELPKQPAAARDNIHVESDTCEEKKDDDKESEVVPPTDESLLQSSEGDKDLDVNDKKEAKESIQSKEDLEKNVEAILGYYSGSMNMNKVEEAVGGTEDFLFDFKNYGDMNTGHTCSFSNFSSSPTASDADLGSTFLLEEKKKEAVTKEEDAPDLSDEDNVVTLEKEFDVEKDADVPGADPDTTFSCRDTEKEPETEKDDVPDLVDEDDVIISQKHLKELALKDTNLLDADLGTTSEEEHVPVHADEDDVVTSGELDERAATDVDVSDADLGTLFSCPETEVESGTKEEDMPDLIDEDDFVADRFSENKAKSLGAPLDDSEIFNDVQDESKAEIACYEDNVLSNDIEATNDGPQDLKIKVGLIPAENSLEDEQKDTASKEKEISDPVDKGESGVLYKSKMEGNRDLQNAKSDIQNEKGSAFEGLDADVGRKCNGALSVLGNDDMDDSMEDSGECPENEMNSTEVSREPVFAEILSSVADNLVEDRTSDTDESESLKKQDAVAKTLSDVADSFAEDPTSDTDENISLKQQIAVAKTLSDVADNLAEDPTSDTTSDTDDSESWKKEDAVAKTLSDVTENLAEAPTSDTDESISLKQQTAVAKTLSDVADNLAEDPTSDTDESISLKQQISVAKTLSDVADNLAEDPTSDTTSDTDDSESWKKEDAVAKTLSDVAENLAEAPTSDTDESISLKQQTAVAKTLSDVADNLAEDPTSDTDESISLKQQDAGAEILSDVSHNLAEDSISGFDSETDATEIVNGTRAEPLSTESSVEHNTQDAAERYQDLHQYERNRRKTSGAHMSTEFKAMLSMLRQGSQECIQYEQFLLGMATANRKYANSMASLTDRNISGDKKTKIKSFFQRGAQKQHPPTPVEVPVTESSNLTTLLDIHRSLADELSDASKHISEEISEEMELYRERLDSKVDNLEIRGASLLEHIESAESQVLKAWNSYSKSVEIINDKQVPSQVGNGSDSSISLEDSTDIWVKELHYRVAVNTFLAQKQEMANLRTEVIATEGERQLKIQEFLLNYLPRQRRAFSSFSELQKPLTNDLIVRKTDTSMEESMRETINKHITKLSNLTPEEQVQASKSCSEPLSLTATMAGFTAMLVERKIGRESWNKTLAIATDSYLHLFHIPSNAQSLTSAMDAFRQLASPFNSSVLEDSSHNKNDGVSSSISSGKALAALTPFQSFHLPKCELNALEDGTGIQIDNSDSFSRGVIQLRTPSQDEASKLMDFLERASDGQESQNDPSTEMLASVVLV